MKNICFHHQPHLLKMSLKTADETKIHNFRVF